MLQPVDVRQTLTPALCRGVRGTLGWTIEEFAVTSGVGVSTIVSFESGQRTPMAANIGAMARAFSDAGVIFTARTSKYGSGFKLTKSAEALREVLMIGGHKESMQARLAKTKERVALFKEEATEFHKGDRSRDISSRVRSDLEVLRNAIDREIARRSRLQLDDQATRFLERVTDCWDSMM
jgi:transcriptional regulator with XRE-family HTH domain